MQLPYVGPLAIASRVPRGVGAGGLHALGGRLYVSRGGGGGARTGAAPAPGSGAGGVADHAALENARVAVIALIDGEHHPSAVRELLARVEAERGLAGVVFCGGEEKLPAGPLAEDYGRPVEDDLEAALGRLAGAADAVLDLADEPVLPPHGSCAWRRSRSRSGWPTRRPGCGSPRRATSRVAAEVPSLAVIATGKRTGKTALAGHLARLLAEHDPVIVCMGAAGRPSRSSWRRRRRSTSCSRSPTAGAHAASDYLEDAVVAGVRTVGCRRVGGGLAGAPAESNVPAGAALAASLRPGRDRVRGLGLLHPAGRGGPDGVHRRPGTPEPLAEYRLLRADLMLAHRGARRPAGGAALRVATRARRGAPGGREGGALHHRRAGLRRR